MKSWKVLTLILINLFFFAWPTHGGILPHQQDQSNSLEDWAHTLNSITHVIASEKIVLSYVETCKNIASIQTKISEGKEIWYKRNKQYVDASKWAVEYYSFTVEKKSGKNESMELRKSIEVNSDIQSSRFISRINDASGSLVKEEQYLMLFDPTGPFSRDISIHKVFNKYIVKIRDMHQEYLSAMANHEQ